MRNLLKLENLRKEHEDINWTIERINGRSINEEDQKVLELLGKERDKLSVEIKEIEDYNGFS